MDSLDSKLVFLLSGSGALLGILLAVYALRPNAFDGWEIALPVVVGLWIALTGFALLPFGLGGFDEPHLGRSNRVAA